MANLMEKWGDPPVLQRGDRVVVHEAGITDRAGVVGAVKPSTSSGWYVEVRYDIDGMTRSIPARFVVREEEAA